MDKSILIPTSYRKFYSSLIARYKDYKLGDFGGFNLSCGTQIFITKSFSVSNFDEFNLFY